MDNKEYFLLRDMCEELNKGENIVELHEVIVGSLYVLRFVKYNVYSARFSGDELRNVLQGMIYVKMLNL